MSGEIGIIGNGFVGGAVAYGFKDKNPLVYDLKPELCKNTLDEVLGCKHIFVCLPTPMVEETGGEANLSIVENCLEKLSNHFTKDSDQVLILKSTVPVGTTNKLAEKYDLRNLIHCPEFLTAANANYDFVNADRTVIGLPDYVQEKYLDMVQKLFEDSFPDIPIYTMSSDESELVKYSANCFLATKVMFFNMIKILSEKLYLDYEKILNGVLSDPRISPSHTKVPGPDGDYGFGGTCFPKDVNALIKTLDDHGIPPSILDSVWEENMRYRENWDWAENNSAVKRKND